MRLLPPAVLPVLLIALALPPTRAGAQVDAGVLVGVSTYEGELTPGTRLRQIEQLGPSVGAFGRFQFSPFAAVRGYYQYLQIEGADRDRASSRLRNLSFFSDLHEAGVQLEFYPLSTARRVTPYVSLGVAAVAYNPKALTPVGEVTLRDLGTEGQGITEVEGFGPKYGRWAAALPLGAGLRFDLNPRLILGLEVVGRLTNTDYLDDVSRLRFVNEEILALNGELAVELAWRSDELSNAPEAQSPNENSRRGNPETNDLYLSGQVTLSYRLGAPSDLKRKAMRRRKVTCPEF